MKPVDSMVRDRQPHGEVISLVDLLRRRALEAPERALFAFLPDGDDGAGVSLTRGELDCRARALAARLQELGLAQGRALLLYPPGLEFITAFFGCLYAGVLAVPAYLPRLNRPMTRLQSIVDDARPCVVLTCASQRKDAPRWEAGVPELRGVDRLITDEAVGDLEERAGRWLDPGAGRETLAFLQYTSGSTAVPKGVMISHGNLLHNSALIHDCFGSVADGHGVFWLPLFHDMGLIGGVIQTLYCGGSSTLFSPVSFVQRPIRWLQTIARTGAIISGAPNFAYELCIEKTTPEQRTELDLSCWRVAFNGAEPVRAETLDRFAEAFAPAGFRPEMFLPCYGLAEATLLVAGGPRGTPPVVRTVDAQALARGDVTEARAATSGKRLVGSGQVVAGQRVVIVDPASAQPCPAGRVGEIWVSGPSVAPGYWGRAKETEEILHATLANGDGPFLRTGDLGFLEEGVLFVTGRLKDLIILRGRNVYPQDVEWTVERCHPAIRTGGAAAFAVELEGQERLAIVQEVERNLDPGVIDEVLAATRRAVAEQHDIDVYAIRLIKMLSLPKTSSGKIQRHACREGFLAGSLEVVAEWTRQDEPMPPPASQPEAPASARGEAPQSDGPARPSPAPDGSTTPAREVIAAWLAARVAGPLGIRPEEVDRRRPLAGFGIGSIQAVRMAAELEEWLGRKLNPTLVYDYPTIDALADFLGVARGLWPLASKEEDRSATHREIRHAPQREPIAIVGIGCRFPGADGPEAFWRLLRDGSDGVGPIPGSRWDAEALKDLNIPHRGGFLQDVAEFDADFFGISPREAIFVDPQHRLLLEVTWEALEDGGQAPERLAGVPVGVFVGISTNDYAQLQVLRGGGGDGYRLTGNAASIAANRISHHFDFRGPSLAIDTACSSSMVAVHLACRSLWDGECDLAIAGGVNLILLPEVFASFAKAGFLSPDGQCRTFDAQANGYVRGEGAGMVVLKPLARALADADPVYAVIRGGAVNQDGRTNGLTAPSRSAQEAVLRAAYRQAGVDPGQVDYLEAHGTGTLLGDPIELAALGAVLAEGREPGRRCALGSVKTNIGHLEAAAGVAGLIKTAMALQHRAIPPSLHFSQPNPHVAFEELPLRVQRQFETWPDSGRPALAGVSSFGFGGTNAHLVLEEAPSPGTIRPVAAGDRKTEEVVIPLSARSPAALWDLACSWRDAVADGSRQLELVDLAYTAGARRGHHDHRLVLVVSSRDEVIEALDAFRRGHPHVASAQGRRLPGRRPGLAFVFSGQGGLWPGAGAALYPREPVFRAAIEECDAILSRHLGWSLATELMAGAPSARQGDPTRDRPVQFALQVALAALWDSWGIVPDRIVGDGIGEIAAAYVAGMLSLEDAARIVAHREPEAGDRVQWAEQVIRFRDAIAGQAKHRFEVHVEIGPHPILASAIKEGLGPGGEPPLVLPSLRRGDGGLESLRWSAAFLYARGFDIEWSRVSPPGRFVHLPGYPWQRQRFWLDDGDDPVKLVATRPLDREDGLDRPAIRRISRSNGHHATPVDGHDTPNTLDGSWRRGPNGLSADAGGAPTPQGHPGGLPADASHVRLVESLRQRVATVLGMEPAQVDPDRPLMTMGLDSLTAMELKVEIETGVGASLPLSILLEGSTIHDLAERASAHLTGSPTRPSQPAAAPVPELALAPAPAEPGQPLSYGQQMLWYAHQYTTTGAAYHVTGAGLVRAELVREAVRRAFCRVIARQDALRTSFVVVDEKPAIRLLDVDELIRRQDEWLPIEDVAGQDNAALQGRLAELASRPFDLERGPLFRVHVLSRSRSEHVFLLVFHHIIADFWSTAVFLDDLKSAYEAERAEPGADRPRPRSRYGDFARWQQEMVGREEGQRHWDYWRQQLAGPLPVLELPTDSARPAVPSYRGAVRHFYLEPELTRSVVDLGESRGASLYTTLLAAFQVLLARYSGLDDIIVGTPVAGRTRPGLEGLVGYFVNLLPMRGDLSGNPPFDEFLGRSRRIVAEGLEHQDFPFSLLVHRLQGNPDPSRPPLFQVMFAHQKIQPLDDQGLAPFALGIPGARLNLHGMAVDSIAFERQTALFDLTMMTAREGDRLCVALEYSTDLFAAATIDRMAAAFRNLLAAIAAEPGTRLADLPLLSATERHQLLGTWAQAPAIPHEEIAIHHRFERQAEATPHAIALVIDGNSLTYGDLNRLANVVAHRLIERGVGPETVVGLYLERWSHRVIGLLGVLKAGGAYLPLDPDHPVERLAAMFEDSGASLLLTEDRLCDRLPGSASAQIALDPLLEAAAETDPPNPSVRVVADNLAYVVFTSGSTGRPKGVMVSHRSLVAAASAWERAYDLRRPALRHLQAAAFSFDVFTGDWVRALTTGGTLVGCPRSILLDPPALAELIRRERIDCLELVPAIAEALAAHLEPNGADLSGIRLLAVGSDTMRRGLYQRLRRLVGPAGRVLNSYGLTETTIDSTSFEDDLEDVNRDRPVPIGRPMPGTRVYVLDDRLAPVPVGVPGELYIGGPGVARGYAGDAMRTAHRFVADPHGGPGARMYATGDRARWRADGTIELLGRRDGQVKVRGFRVEPAEVESALARHPGVRAAAVVARADAQGETRLAAYVVPETVPGPTAADLRRWLKDRLPEPMVPTSFLLLEEIPLLPSGKLDRAALPVPEVEDVPGGAYAPPRTTSEEILAGITADLLGRSRVGVQDNLFELGVDSIVGIQIVSRARQAGLALDPAQLFLRPTIAELAATADSKGDPGAGSVRAVAPFELAPEGLDRAALERAFESSGGIEDAYPLTPVQEGMLFHTLADPEAGHYLEQFLCRVRGELDLPVLQESWHRLVARHPALRTTIHWTDFERPYQVVHRRAEAPVDYQDWRGLAPAEQDQRLTAYLDSDRRRGFVPSRPPLSRLALLRCGDDVHQLVWSIHHVVIDGWCLSVLLHELLDLYEAIRIGREPAAGPSRPFRDYVAWLDEQDEEPAQAYWRGALQGLTAATPIGLDEHAAHGRGSASEAAAERQIRLAADVTGALQALARSGQLTLSTLIQGAWALLLSRYSGRSDVLFGVTVSGRPPELAGVESMVGMFINVLPLRVGVTEESHLVPWLRALQAQMVELRRFESIPLARIRTWSDVPPGMPLFESVVIVQNLPFVASLQERADRLGIEAARYLERTHYPIALTALPGAELALKIGFDARRVDPTLIERALGHLRNLLEAMAADPQQRLVDLPAMPASEQEHLIGQWNRLQDESVLLDLDIDQLSEEELDTLIDRLN